LFTPFRFIHAADLHLDSPFKGLKSVPSEIRQSLLEATFQAVNQLCTLAIEHKVSFIVISGDLFDEAKRSLQAQLHLIKQYKRLAQYGIGVYIIHGNHDPLGGYRTEQAYPDNVHVFASDGVTVKTAYDSSGQPLAYLYGKSYERRAETENVALQFKRTASEGYHIGLYHGNIGGAAEHDNYAPCKLADLLMADMDYWALGHIHKRQILHKEPYVIYAGNTQGRHILESGDKGCYLVSVDEYGTTNLQFKSLAPIIWTELAVSIDHIRDEHELLSKIEDTLNHLYQELDGQSMLVQLVITGKGGLHQSLQKEDVRSALLKHIQEEHGLSSPFIFVHHLAIQTHADYALAEIQSEESFLGDILRFSDEILLDAELQQRLLELAERELAQHKGLYRMIKGVDNTSNVQEEEITEARNYVIDWLMQQQAQEVKS